MNTDHSNIYRHRNFKYSMSNKSAASASSDLSEYKVEVGELTKKVIKTIKKFAKRRGKEQSKNTENKDFEFVALNEWMWYFKFTIEHGLYKGQSHIVEMKLLYGRSPDIYVYPSCAPKCSFVTPVWHPNVSKTGTICLDVLKSNWTPAMFTSSIISAVQVLLETPNPSSPLNNEAAKTLDKGDHDKYTQQITDFCNYESASKRIRSLFDDDL